MPHEELFRNLESEIRDQNLEEIRQNDGRILFWAGTTLVEATAVVAEGASMLADPSTPKGIIAGVLLGAATISARKTARFYHERMDIPII